jgi:hypothetical protein
MVSSALETSRQGAWRTYPGFHPTRGKAHTDYNEDKEQYEEYGNADVWTCVFHVVLKIFGLL